MNGEKKFKVKQREYNYQTKQTEDCLRDTDSVFQEDMFTQPPPNSRFSYRDDKSIEGKIEALGDVVSKLMANLLDKGIIVPDEIEKILAFTGEIVEE